MSTDPTTFRAQITAAEKRAGRRQVRILIVALIGGFILAAFSVAGFFLAYSQARKNANLTQEVIGQSAQIKKLAEDQATNSQTGRDILKRLSDATSSSATQTVQALQQLDDAQRVGRADQLKKVAQLFQQCTRLPCDPAVVNRILAQPVPVPTFGAAPAPAPSPAVARPASTAGASVGKSSSAASAPKPCPGPVVIQATPLVLPLLPPTQVQVCIP